MHHEDSPTYRPLGTISQAMFMMYFFVLTPAALFFGIGIIFMAALAMGMRLSKKHQNAKILQQVLLAFALLFALLTVVAAVVIAQFLDNPSAWGTENNFLAFMYISLPLGYTVIALICWHIVRQHFAWISVHGILGEDSRGSRTAPTPKVAPPTAKASVSMLDELKRLNRLKKAGKISQEDFAQQKRALVKTHDTTARRDEHLD